MEKKSIFKSVENQEKQTPRPGLLDLIEIDGRLAQYVSDVGTVVFLDNKEPASFQPDDYTYEKTELSSVEDLIKKNLITKKEWDNIVYGPEQNKMPSLKNLVSFFGKYKKKR